jgi:putative tryptophan/tyrosine transport system substrate-binding protein
MTTQPLSPLTMLLSRHTRRREFITLLGGAAAWPLAARGQQPATPIVGLLSSGTSAGLARFVTAFHQGLGQGGYIENQNVTIEYRWANNKYDQLPTLADDLVRRQVNVIATLASTPAASAAKAATTAIPIVFYTAFDPVEVGLVDSLSRPAGNITGVTSLGAEVGPKRLELMHQLVPTASLIALLINPGTPGAESQARDLLSAAHNLGLKLHVLNSSSESEFEQVFATVGKLGTGVLLIGNDSFLYIRRKQLIGLAERLKVPTIFPWRDAVLDGALMSYGASLEDAHRQVGIYTSRILKGTKPSDLPVVQAVKLEMIINLKTAKALGLTVPDKLLALADEVIE